MIGVVLLIMPSVIIPSISDEQSSFAREDYPNFNLGVFITLTASVCSGFAYLSMRKIGMSVHPVTNTFYFGVLNVQSCFLLSIVLKEEIIEPLNWTTVGLLVLVGFFGWIAQEGVTAAVSLAPAARVAPINYMQVIIAWIADVVLFNTPVMWTDILGTFMIIFFTFISTL